MHVILFDTGYTQKTVIVLQTVPKTREGCISESHGRRTPLSLRVKSLLSTNISRYMYYYNQMNIKARFQIPTLQLRQIWEWVCLIDEV